MRIRSVRFTAAAAETLLSYRQTGRKPEQGGVLLGRVSLDGEAVVERVSLPGPGDRFGRFFFDRGRQRAQEAVDRAWTESGGELIYVGEWHTHPEQNPNPSPRDRAMIRNMRTDSRMHLDSLVLTIIGTTSEWTGIETPEGLGFFGSRLEIADA